MEHPSESEFRFRVPRPVLLAIPATGDTIMAEVNLISPYLDEASRTCDVVVRFDNIDSKFRSGMFARAQIAGFVVPDLLLVPEKAIGIFGHHCPKRCTR